MPRWEDDAAMILPAQEICRRCALPAPMIWPFVERNVVRGMSFGLSGASYDVRIAESMTIDPGEFVLASTIERFCIPNDVLIVAHDKSSWARRGLAVQNTVFDPGWRGYATLELTNHGRSSLAISAGDPIAQVVCHLLTEPTKQPYSGKYQDQEAGPQHARDDGPRVAMTDVQMDVAKVEALVAVLKTALPELVTIAFTRFKAELSRIVPGLSGEEWKKLVREENQRRERRPRRLELGRLWQYVAHPDIRTAG
jgi:dCTP deaminase